MDNILHITNGDSLTHYLSELKVSGTFLTWREILCEGPTVVDVFSEAFISKRKKHLNAETDYDVFVAQFDSFSENDYDEIVLWFEYDLFCHVNLSAVVNFLSQQDIQIRISLVCSGFVDDLDRLYGLSELTENQLRKHFEQRVILASEDKVALTEFWKIYCTSDHKKLIEIPKGTQLKYLKQCIQSHFRRYPDVKTGLSHLEWCMLEKVANEHIRNQAHWVNVMLSDQGYYGFGDLQFKQLANKLSPFINQNEFLELSELGKKVLEKRYNAFDILKDDTQFGGSLKYSQLYCQTEQTLIPIA